MNQNMFPHNHNKSPLNLHKLLFPLLFLFFLFPFLGCERIIDVDLNEASPAVVIEGNLSYAEKAIEVKISKTGSYFDTSPTEKVDNAEVFLENGDSRMKLNGSGEGVYKLDRLTAEPGMTFRLLVELDGTEYSAESTLHPAVEIDSLGYAYYNGARFFEGGYRLNLYFADPPEQKNYYRVKVYKNGTLLNEVGDLIVFDDTGLDGKGIQVRLRGQIFETGDEAKVEFRSIDENAWEYFTTFREMANTNPGSPAPANPISNFSNGALGYFSAWSGDIQTITIE